MRKSIIAFDADNWGTSAKKMEESCTVFKDEAGHIIANFSEYPRLISREKGGRIYRYTQDNQMFGRKLAVIQAEEFKKTIGGANIGMALMDCSLRGKDDGRIKPLYEMGLLEMGPSTQGKKDHYDILGEDFINGIYSGMVKRAREVLVFKEIPGSFIERIFSPVEIDCVYALLKKGKTFEDILQKKEWLDKLDISVSELCYEDACDQCGDKDDLKKLYDAMMEVKRKKIRDGINSVFGESFEKIDLPEDDLLVFDLDHVNEAKCIEDKKYDIIAIKKDGKIFKVGDRGFEKTRNESIEFV